MSEHTPTPYCKISRGRMLRHRRGPGFDLMQDGVPLERAVVIADKLSEPDADFIVRACNAHDDLLAACEDVVKTLDPRYKGAGALEFIPLMNKVHAAIQKAKP